MFQRITLKSVRTISANTELADVGAVAVVVVVAAGVGAGAGDVPGKSPAVAEMVNSSVKRVARASLFMVA